MSKSEVLEYCGDMLSQIADLLARSGEGQLAERSQRIAKDINLWLTTQDGRPEQVQQAV